MRQAGVDGNRERERGCFYRCRLKYRGWIYCWGIWKDSLGLYDGNAMDRDGDGGEMICIIY